MNNIRLLPKGNEELYDYLVKEIACNLTEKDIVLVDKDITKKIIKKFSKNCERVYYCSSIAMTEFARELKPTVIVTISGSDILVDKLHKITPDTIIYNVYCEKEEKRVCNIEHLLREMLYADGIRYDAEEELKKLKAL